MLLSTHQSRHSCLSLYVAAGSHDVGVVVGLGVGHRVKALLRRLSFDESFNIRRGSARRAHRFHRVTDPIPCWSVYAWT